MDSQWLSWTGTSHNYCHQSSMSACGVHHNIHSAYSMGEVWGYWASKFVRGHPPLLHQPGTSPPHSRAPGVGAPVKGDTLTALLLPPPSTNWNHPASCLQSPRSARTSGGLCPPQHLFLGSHQRMRGSTLSKDYTPLLSARGKGVPRNDIA